MSDAWDREIAALRQRIADAEERLEELLAAGPVAPGVVEATAEMAREAARLAERLTDRASGSEPST